MLIGSRLVVTGYVLVHVVFVFVGRVVLVAAAALGETKSFVYGIGQAGGRLGGWSGFYAWVIGIVIFGAIAIAGGCHYFREFFFIVGWSWIFS